MISDELYFFFRNEAPVIFIQNGVEGVLVTENDGLARWVARLLNKNPGPTKVFKFEQTVEVFIDLIGQMGVHALFCIDSIDDNQKFKATTYIFAEKNDAGLPLPE